MSKDSEWSALSTQQQLLKLRGSIQDLETQASAINEQQSREREQYELILRPLPKEIPLLELMRLDADLPKHFNYTELHELSETGEDVRITRRLDFPLSVKRPVISKILGLTTIDYKNDSSPQLPAWPFQRPINQHEIARKIEFNGLTYQYTPVRYENEPPGHRSFPWGIYSSATDRERDMELYMKSLKRHGMYKEMSKTRLVLGDEYYLAQNCLRKTRPGEKLTKFSLTARVHYDQNENTLKFSHSNNPSIVYSLEEFNANNMSKLQEKQNELRMRHAAKEAQAVVDEQKTAERNREEERAAAVREEAGIARKLNEVRRIARDQGEARPPSMWRKLFCNTRVRSDKRKRENIFSK